MGCEGGLKNSAFTVPQSYLPKKRRGNAREECRCVPRCTCLQTTRTSRSSTTTSSGRADALWLWAPYRTHLVMRCVYFFFFFFLVFGETLRAGAKQVSHGGAWWSRARRAVRGMRSARDVVRLRALMCQAGRVDIPDVGAFSLSDRAVAS